jgi:probable rRNA maturation factor
MEIKVFNEVEGFKVPRKKIDEVFGKFCEAEKRLVRKRFMVSLVFVGEKKMEGMNESWKGGEGVTDVLSFNYENDLGEIYICVAEAERNAAEDGRTMNEEVYALVVHGMLHLVGYTHDTDDDYEKMMKRAEKVLG